MEGLKETADFLRKLSNACGRQLVIQDWGNHWHVGMWGHHSSDIYGDADTLEEAIEKFVLKINKKVEENNKKGRLE